VKCKILKKLTGDYMHKINIVLLILLLVCIKFSIYSETQSSGQEEIVIKEMKINGKFGVKKVRLPLKKIDSYSKIILESSVNTLTIQSVRLFFITGAEQNIAVGKEKLILTPETRLELDITNRDNLKKITVYYGNLRDKAKSTDLKVILVK